MLKLTSSRRRNARSFGGTALMGGLNSLMVQKCDGEYHKSLITTSNPKHDVMEFIRKTH
jgi:hypothetical protein